LGEDGTILINEKPSDNNTINNSYSFAENNNFLLNEDGSVIINE